ncbi:MAG: hypothetical protein M3Y91_08860 [Actinomycetota bacterium]|nr:hypothetical protein [Actinomycetota bacterium]
MELAYHPGFVRWFAQLADVDIEIAGEVQALVDALSEHGLDLGDPESHPVVTSSMGLRALRRTPPTAQTPYAIGPPVLRILYGFAAPPAEPLRAVLLFGGDKTRLGSRWYPPAVAEAERRLTILAGQLRWRTIHS